MNLHKHACDDSGLLRLPVDQVEKTLGVDAFNQGYFPYQLFHLIGLKMPDEMPAYISRQLPLLLDKFLNTAFSEAALTCIVSLPDHRGGMKLGNSHKFHPLGYLLTDTTQILLQTHRHSGLAAGLPLRSAGYTSIRGVSVIEAMS